MTLTCPACNDSQHIGSRPREANYTEPGKLWYRCWTCGLLWDADTGEDVVLRHPELAFKRPPPHT